MRTSQNASIAFVLWVLIFASVICSQDSSATQESASAVPAFEVVSIKRNLSNNGGSNWNFLPLVGIHVSATNVPAKAIIETAYDIKDFQLSGGPAWITSEKYDLEAGISESLFEKMRKLPQEEQVREFDLMLQSLLSDRFKLQLTRQTKEVPILALVVSKDTSKIGPLVDQPFPKNPGGSTMIEIGRNGQRKITATKTTTENLASALTRVLGQEVLDKTDIVGNYTFTISWADPMQAGPGTPNDSSGPSLQAALQDQLGLKLVPSKGPVETITIDHIEEPSPN
jgi:uncharacterized protein (TIGR03435 family)